MVQNCTEKFTTVSRESRSSKRQKLKNFTSTDYRSNRHVISGSHGDVCLPRQWPFVSINSDPVGCDIKILEESIPIYRNIEDSPALRARGSIFLEIECNVVSAIRKWPWWPLDLEWLSLGCSDWWQERFCWRFVPKIFRVHFVLVLLNGVQILKWIPLPVE